MIHQQVRLQQQALAELSEGLAQLRRLGRGGSAQAGLDVRKCVTRLLHSMGRLGRAAAAVLAPEPLLRLVAALLGPVCGAAVGHVLSKRCVLQCRCPGCALCPNALPVLQQCGARWQLTSMAAANVI